MTEERPGPADPAIPAAKLPDEELRRLAEEDTGTEASVIVELDLPAQRVEMARGGAAGGLARAVGVAPEGDRERRERQATVETARRFLCELTGEEPVHLRAARAFAVRVTGAQLRAIARSPWARRIRRNRTRER